MVDGHVTTREFDGFAKAMRDAFEQSDKSTNLLIGSMSGKLDALLVGKSEEARNMGELQATVNAILERLNRNDVESAEFRMRSEKDSGELKAQIEELWNHHEQHSDGKLKWWGNVVLVFITAGVTWAVSSLSRGR